jgi:hypothetical protein
MRPLRTSKTGLKDNIKMDIEQMGCKVVIIVDLNEWGLLQEITCFVINGILSSESATRRFVCFVLIL